MRTCITYLAVDVLEQNGYYTDKCIESLESYLKHTDFDAIVYTNKPDKFEANERVTIISPEEDDILVNSWGEVWMHREVHFFLKKAEYGPNKWSSPVKAFFNYTLKFRPIALAAERGYDVVYHIDADTFTTGWDESSWRRMLTEDDTDLFVGSRLEKGTLGIDGHSNKIFRRLSWPVKHTIHHREDRMIFKNNDKLLKMIKEVNNLFNQMSGEDKVYAVEAFILGIAEARAGMRVEQVLDHHLFTQYEKIIDCDKNVLDRWWNKEL